MESNSSCSLFTIFTQTINILIPANYLHTSIMPIFILLNWTQQHHHVDGQLEHQRLQPQLTARDAIAIAERRYGGRAVGAKKIGNAYKVRILQDDGKIKNVIIDGK